MPRLRRAAAVLLGVFAGCAHRQSLPAPDEEPGGRPVAVAEVGTELVGYASWYGARLAGRRTASGEPFDPSQMTAAHRSLPFGTWVEVRRIDTGQAVRVRITDRGPYGSADRVIDLSSAAAKQIGMLRIGVARVQIRVVAGP